MSTIAMLLAGGKGSRLNILAKHRAKPALPFMGMYRLIDYPLSNAMNSGISNIGILTQYKPGSLMKHIQNGEHWGFYGRNRSAAILPPYKSEGDFFWYRGTADAIAQNIDYIENIDGTSRVLILSGDHIYKMNYKNMIREHKKRKADVTLVVLESTIEEASRFGTVIVDGNDRVLEFEEKPEKPRTNLISLGIYLFNKSILIDELKKDTNNKNSSHDFGKDILPKILHKKIYVHRFNGYWKDVGTIDSYWQTSMDMLKSFYSHEILDGSIYTNSVRNSIADMSSSYFSKTSNISNSFICDGCKIEGTVLNSIISPGVVIEKGSIVKDSIVFHDSKIKSGTEVHMCVVDKDVIIGKKCSIGVGDLPGLPNKEHPNHLDTGITIIGKGASIVDNIKIGRNVIVEPFVSKKNFTKTNYKSGSTIYFKREE